MSAPGPHQHSLLLFCRELLPSWLVTDFFWFLQYKSSVKNGERDVRCHLVSLSSSAAASDLTAALSKENT